jgi:hypothetical protein
VRNNLSVTQMMIKIIDRECLGDIEFEESHTCEEKYFGTDKF